MPAQSAQIQRVLAIPTKRYTRKEISFLTHPEVEALLAVPNQKTWSGRRDHALLLATVQTGARLSEVTALKREDVSLGAGAHIHVLGGAVHAADQTDSCGLEVLAAGARERQERHTPMMHCWTF